MNTKYKVGDVVQIKYDASKDYGNYLGLIGTICFVGALHKGHRTYHIVFEHKTGISVYENDLVIDPVKKKILKKLWIMFYQDKYDHLQWYPLAKKKYYEGEKQTKKDLGCHTFSLVCVNHLR
jgi:hypothetical protein